MKNSTILLTTILLLCCATYVAQGQSTSVAEDVLLTVKDHSGDNFLVLKVEECVLTGTGALTCAMEQQKKVKPIQAGPSTSMWNKLAYPNS